MDKLYMRVTRKDVAQRANVTETIVSYVMNNNRCVDPDKRKRVLRAVEELHYQPNAIAKSLRSNRSQHIAFLTDEINNEYFGSIMLEMEQYANQFGYVISLCNIRENDSYIVQLQARQFDGIVVSGNISEALINKFVDTTIPMVILANRLLDGAYENTSVIRIDLYTSAMEAMRQLLQDGRQRIVYVDNSFYKPDLNNVKDLRLKAYQDALLEAGMIVQRDNLIVESHVDTLFTAIQARLNSGARPDAFFCHDDRLAMVAMSAVHRLKLRIPEDIAIIGFDNSVFSRFSIPLLSTVDIPRAQIGQIAIELLDKAINQHTSQHIVLATRFVRREST